MFQEQLRVAASVRRTHQQAARAPVERAGHVPLLVIARGYDLGLAATFHPAGADLGVEVHIHLVLEEGRFVSGQRMQQSANLLHFLGVIRVIQAERRSRPAPHESQLPQASANRFAAQPLTGLPSQCFGQQLARPARTEETKVLRRTLRQPLDYLPEPTGKSRLRRLSSHNRSDPFLLETADATLDQIKTGERNGSHLPMSPTFRQQKDNMCSSRDSRILSRAVSDQKLLALLLRQTDTVIHGLGLLLVT